MPTCALITLFTSLLLAYPDGCVDGCVVSGVGCTGWVSLHDECLQRSCEPAARLLLLLFAVFDSKASSWVCAAWFHSVAAGAQVCVQHGIPHSLPTHPKCIPQPVKV